VIHNQMLNTTAAMNIPALIHAAAITGDFTPLAELDLAASQYQPPQGLVMFYTIFCKEPWAAYDPDEMQSLGADSYYLQSTLNAIQSRGGACDLIPDPGEALYATDLQPVDAPTLVLMGEFDSQNPPENMAGAEEILVNGQFVFEPRQGHSAVNTLCRNILVNTFLSDPSKPLNTECLEDGLPHFNRP
jgi:pimeloyl-ACP methyl ester carboxylesterase